LERTKIPKTRQGKSDLSPFRHIFNNFLSSPSIAIKQFQTTSVSKMESLLRVCNILSTAGECIDHWETVKQSLLYKNDDDDVTIATVASDISITDKEDSAIVIQAGIRGMIVRTHLRDEARKAKRARIEDTLESAQAILRANRKVWSRCKRHIRGGGGLPHTVFTRIGYSSILVTTKSDTVRFTTRAERNYKSFDTKALSTLHPKLSGVFEVEHGEYDFVNYAAFLQKMLLFHEVILEPFLEIFKAHLETVRECLGEIDAWIQQPHTNLQFLQTAFDLDNTLELPDENRIHSITKSSGCVAKSLRNFELNTDLQITAAFDIERGRDTRKLKQLLECFMVDQIR
jgi:hypothetical protein